MWAATDLCCHHFAQSWIQIGWSWPWWTRLAKATIQLKASALKLSSQIFCHRHVTPNTDSEVGSRGARGQTVMKPHHTISKFLELISERIWKSWGVQDGGHGWRKFRMLQAELNKRFRQELRKMWEIFFFSIKSSEFDKDQYCIAPPSSSSWDFPVFAQLLAFPETQLPRHTLVLPADSVTAIKKSSL